MPYVRAFVAGFLATLIFHQGVLALMHASGMVPAPPFPMQPTWPFDVPKVISLAFWGGVWGVILWLLIGRRRLLAQPLLALAIGAIAPTAVALLVVFPLQGREVTAAMVPIGLANNAAWGLGTWLIVVALRSLLGGR